MKRASIGATSFAGSTAWPLSAAKNFRIGNEIAVYLRRELERELDGLVVDK